MNKQEERNNERGAIYNDNNDNRDNDEELWLKDKNNDK